jgi:hypothetical protein
MIHSDWIASVKLSKGAFEDIASEEIDLIDCDICGKWGPSNICEHCRLQIIKNRQDKINQILK